MHHKLCASRLNATVNNENNANAANKSVDLLLNANTSNKKGKVASDLSFENETRLNCSSDNPHNESSSSNSSSSSSSSGSGIAKNEDSFTDSNKKENILPAEEAAVLVTSDDATQINTYKSDGDELQVVDNKEGYGKRVNLKNQNLNSPISSTHSNLSTVSPPCKNEVS